MAQFQHPTADVFGAATGGAAWFSTEATYAEALVAAESSKFISSTTDIAAGAFGAVPQGDDVIGPKGAELTWTFNAVTDPGINTGHIVRIRLKAKVLIIPFGSPPAPWPGYDPSFRIIFAGSFRDILLSSLSDDVWATVAWTMTSGEVDYYRANGGYAGTGPPGVCPLISFFGYGTVFPPDGGSHLISFDLLEVEVPDGATSIVITGDGGLDVSGGLPGGGFDLSGGHLQVSGSAGSAGVSATLAGCPPTFVGGADSGGGSGCPPSLSPGSDSAGGSGCGVSL